MTTNFFHHIYTALQEFPAQEVVVWPEVMGKAHPTIATAGKLLDSVTTTGRGLQQNGIRKGQKIILLLPIGPELISALLAVMAIGAVPVLPPAGISKTGFLKLIRREGYATILIPKAPGLIASIAFKALKLKIVTTAGMSTSDQEWLQPEPVDPDQAALISHSSGSTGQPKAIYRSHRVLTAQHKTLKQVFPPFEGQKDFPLFPNILLHNLAVGSKSVLPAIPNFNLTRLDPAKIEQQLIQEKINTLTGNVFYFRKLLERFKLKQLAFPQVTALGIGGSPVPENLANDLQKFFPNAGIYIIYGSSEAEPIAVRKVGEDTLNPAMGYAVGPVISGLECRILPIGKLNLLNGKIAEAGEILVRGKHVATQQNNWLHTGDFGYLNEAGKLFLTGRQGNEKIHQGVQHYQLEHLLQHLPGVNRVAARALPDGFTIYVEGNVTEKMIRETLSENFPSGIINAILFHQKLPVDSRHHSKILYAKLN